jgi:hypothetical protein
MDLRQVYNSWRKLWQERRLPEAKPAAPEAPATPSPQHCSIGGHPIVAEFDLADPEAKASEPVNVLDLHNLRAELDRKSEFLDQLERSLGLAAAKVIVPTVTGDSQSFIDKYNNMPEGEAKAAFYRQHRDVLVKRINQPTP